MPAATARFRPAAVAVTVLLVLLTAPVEGRDGYPRIFNIYLTNTFNPDVLDRLARYDLLALHVDFPFENPGGIAQIRALNPDAVILAYIPINDTRDFSGRPPETVSYQVWHEATVSDFWLYDAAGEIMWTSNGKINLNLTPNSPVNAQGEKYWEWFVRFTYEEIWKEGASEWDGRDEGGRTVGRGVYLLRIRSEGGSWSRKVFLGR